MGWQIVKHSFLMLWRNLSNALLVSVGPAILAILISGLALAFSGVTPQMLTFGLVTGNLPGQAVLVLVFVLIVMVFAISWIAVSWHRFILLEDYPGVLPAIANRPVWTYAGLSMLLGLIMLGALLPFVIVASIVTAIVGNTAVPSLIVGIAGGIYFTYFWLRTALILPALSVGAPLAIRAAWTVTGAASMPILQAASILVVINVLGSMFIGAVSAGVIGFIIEMAFSWITLMAGTSILTTLYGVLVEKRELPA